MLVRFETKLSSHIFASLGNISIFPKKLYKSEVGCSHSIWAFSRASCSGCDKLRKSLGHTRVCVEKEKKIINEHIGFEVLTVATMKSKIFLVVTPCNYEILLKGFL
jgi:hypothetical protein